MFQVFSVLWLFRCVTGLQFTDYPGTPGTVTTPNIEGTNTFIYQAKGYATTWCGEAQILFKTTDSRNAFAMMLDGWGGQLSAAQIWPSSGSGLVEEHKIQNTNELDLKCDQFKGFWVTWGNDIVQMGTGIEPGVNTVWAVLATVLVGNRIRYVQLPTHKANFKVAPPYNSSPQITSSCHIQWSDTDKASLTDRNNDTCLSVTTAVYLRVQLSTVFSSHLYNEFRLRIIAVSLGCSHLVQVYGVGTQTSQSLRLCEFLKQEDVNGKESCEFQCKCYCDSIVIQKLITESNTQLCEVYYP